MKVNKVKANKIVEASLNALYDAVIVEKTITNPQTLVLVVKCVLDVLSFENSETLKDKVSEMSKITPAQYFEVEKVTVKEEDGTNVQATESEV